jgi:lysophospholipase L1-like esterase
MTNQRHASRLITQIGETTWNLVALGDSTPTGKGIGEEYSYVQIYAQYIEKDLEVDVMVHNWATNETQTVANWVEKVCNNEELRKDLRNADVITMWLGWHDLVAFIFSKMNGSSLDEVDVHSLREITNPMQDNFDRLLSEIVSLASPDETLILIADVGIPPLFVIRWKKDGTFAMWKRHSYEVWRNYIIQAATKHNVHVVPTYELINGANGDQKMPSEYMQDDNVHFNEQGHKMIADIHRKVGYRYSSSRNSN